MSYHACRTGAYNYHMLSIVFCRTVLGHFCYEHFGIGMSMECSLLLVGKVAGGEPWRKWLNQAEIERNIKEQDIGANIASSRPAASLRTAVIDIHIVKECMTSQFIQSIARLDSI